MSLDALAALVAAFVWCAGLLSIVVGSVAFVLVLLVLLLSPR